MKKQSLTITGVAIMLLVFIAQGAGVDVAPENVQTTIETLLQFGGIAMAYFGRIRHGDVNWLGRKK